MEHRLLLIETSATQRYVATNFLEESGFSVKNAENYTLALKLLDTQFSDLDSAADCVILSWPVSPEESIQPVLEALEGPDYHDLPVVVLSQNMPAQARAWVAGREHTVLTNWREYKSVSGVLERLLGEPGSDAANLAHPPKFSNADISVLVVDDSPSIRYALSDLLGLHGYRVTVVADSAGALEALDQQRFDIAIVDYYLTEETGDDVCRQLMAHPAGENLTCAVLTGNYADHIIQQSLRAGAVECMFKNESSELLLARIDAISRLVRGRSQQHSDRGRLFAALSSVKQGIVAVDAKGEITFANREACTLLSATAEGLRGLELTKQLLPSFSPEQLAEFQAALTSGADMDTTSSSLAPLQGEAFKAELHGVSLGAGEGMLLYFDCGDKLLNTAPAITAPEDVVEAPVVPGVGYSYLLMAAEFSAGGSELRSVALSEKLVQLISTRLSQRLIQADRYAYLGHGLFAVVVAHRTPQESYLAARQLGALIGSLGASMGKVEIVCHASLTPMVTPNLRDKSVFAQAKKGALVAKRKAPNQIYLADCQRLLPVHPPKK